MKGLSLTTCQAANTVAVCEVIAACLASRLRIPVEFVDGITWQERYRLINRGEIDIGWICGKPYVEMTSRPDAMIQLLAAPVMSAERYQNRPVYFSDVIVRRDSRFFTFDDLQGASWAYNEPGSQSGYNITRAYLASRGERHRFFKSTVASGAHLTSLGMVLSGRVDASAIDSTVLDWELRRKPEIRSQLRLIKSLGPSPMPPWVISKRVPGDLRSFLCRILLEMDQDEQGRSILATGDLARFAQVDDEYYDPIRTMAQLAELVPAWRDPDRRFHG